MDQDGCTVPFTDTECLKFLKAPQLVLLEKIRSEKAVGAAGIAGLSYCPHCSYGCVIENAGKFSRLQANRQVYSILTEYLLQPRSYSIV